MLNSKSHFVQLLLKKKNKEQFSKELLQSWWCTHKLFLKSETFITFIVAVLLILHPTKQKCILIRTLFHNFFILSNWSKNLKQLITALCKINLINKERKCNSLMTEIQNT